MLEEVYKNLKKTWIKTIKKEVSQKKLKTNWKDLIKDNDSYCSDCCTLIYKPENFEIEHIEGSIENVLGYNTEEVDAELFIKSIHKDDLPIANKFEKLALLFYTEMSFAEKRKYGYKYDVRFKNKNGEYVRLQKEVNLLCINENTQELRLTEKYRNINNFKKEGESTLCFKYLDNNGLFSEKLIPKQNISPSEKKVLLLLIEGLSSKEIAKKLHLSKETVDTHRKNMIKKINVSNTSQLIAKSLINQLITI